MRETEKRVITERERKREREGGKEEEEGDLGE